MRIALGGHDTTRSWFGFSLFAHLLEPLFLDDVWPMVTVRDGSVLC
jgi:hypothetical protein